MAPQRERLRGLSFTYKIANFLPDGNLGPAIDFDAHIQLSYHSRSRSRRLQATNIISGFRDTIRAREKKVGSQKKRTCKSIHQGQNSDRAVLETDAIEIPPLATLPPPRIVFPNPERIICRYKPRSPRALLFDPQYIPALIFSGLIPWNMMGDVKPDSPPYTKHLEWVAPWSKLGFLSCLLPACKQKTPKKKSLMDLPIEIRHMIFEELLPGHRVVRIDQSPQRCNQYEDSLGNLRSVCRQLRFEVRDWSRIYSVGDIRYSPEIGLFHSLKTEFTIDFRGSLNEKRGGAIFNNAQYNARRFYHVDAHTEHIRRLTIHIVTPIQIVMLAELFWQCFNTGQLWAVTINLHCPRPLASWRELVWINLFGEALSVNRPRSHARVCYRHPHGRLAAWCCMHTCVHDCLTVNFLPLEHELDKCYAWDGHLDREWESMIRSQMLETVAEDP